MSLLFIATGLTTGLIFLITSFRMLENVFVRGIQVATTVKNASLFITINLMKLDKHVKVKA